VTVFLDGDTDRSGQARAMAARGLIRGRSDAPGASYRLVGLEIQPAEGVFLYNLVEIRSAETSAGALPP
jgi:hypothetical protein